MYEKNALNNFKDVLGKYCAINQFVELSKRCFLVEHQNEIQKRDTFVKLATEYAVTLTNYDADSMVCEICRSYIVNVHLCFETFLKDVCRQINKYGKNEYKPRIQECVCGKENLRYLFTIRNRETGRSLYLIGSSCIEKFERDDLDYEVDVQMDMYRLAHAMERGERIELTSKYFSKKLLYALYEEGAFAPNKYNRYDGTNDYQFMLDMFNKRNKSEITEQQHRKIRGLIAYSIKPFLRERLKYK